MKHFRSEIAPESRKKVTVISTFSANFSIAKTFPKYFLIFFLLNIYEGGRRKRERERGESQLYYWENDVRHGGRRDHRFWQLAALQANRAADSP